MSAQVVWPFRDKSSLNVHYPEAGVKSALLNTECEAVYEYWNGSAWVEPMDSRFRLAGKDRDRLEAVPTTRLDFIALVPSMLESAYVWESAGLETDTEGNILFSAASPGRILRTLFLNAQARGWGAALAMDFTDTHDSNGQPWASAINLALPPSQTLYELLSALGNQGVVDWAGQGRTLRVFNPDTFLGRDRTNIRLLAGQGETAAPEQTSFRDRATVLRVVGENGNAWDRANGASPWGRLESIMSAGGVEDEGTAYLLSDEALLTASGTRISRTREFDGESKYLPHRDYRSGDHVSYQTGTSLESMRVFSMSVTIDARLSGYAVLGDRFEDALIAAARKQNALVIGRVQGGNGQQPSPDGDVRTPAAPTGFIGSTSAYVDPTGQEVGRVSVGWNHTGKATDGTAIVLDRFEFRIRDTGTTQWESFRSVAGDERTAGFSPVDIRREDGQAAVYDFAVRAVAGNSRASAWVYLLGLLMETDAVPPPVPAALTAEDVSYGVATVAWNGEGAGGELMPPDFSHVEGEVGSTPIGPWTYFGSFERAASQNIPFAQTAGTYWLRARAVDQVGNKSEWSALTEYELKPLVELPDVKDLFAEVDMDISGVWDSANGKNRVRAGDTPPMITGNERDGDIYWQWDDTNLIGQWIFNDAVWKQVELGHQIIAAIDAGKITVGFLHGQRIQVGTLEAKHILISDFTNYATVDPVANVNVTLPASSRTVSQDGYTRKAAGGLNVLAFADQVGPVPLKSDEWIYVEFIGVSTQLTATSFMVWVYPDRDGTDGAVTATYPSLEFTTTPKSFGFALKVPNLAGIQGGQSWAFGLSGSGIRHVGVKNVRVYRQAGATYIGPEAIRTPHLMADLIEGKHLKGNIIEGDHLKFGFADGKVITGALLQTLSDPSRGIKLDGLTNTMRGWNGSSEMVFDLNANNGDLQLGKNQMIKLYGASGNIDLGNGKMVFDATTGNLTIQGEFATSNSGRRARLSDTNLTAALNVYADNTNARGAIYSVKPETTNMVQTAYRYHSDSASGSDYEFQYAMTENTWRISSMDTEFFVGFGPTGADPLDTYIESPVIFNRPYTLTANVVITANGILGIVSSASRYKLDQRVMVLDDELLDVPVKDWLDVTENEEIESLGKLGVRTQDQQVMFSRDQKRVPGVVAEDVAAVASGESFVIRDGDGLTQGVAYDRLAIAQIAVLTRKVKALESLLGGA
ncbi:hypothetical protein [Arthrobacter sp. MYb221]|uniref:hypothetical protein n=1 Tax=Arthrobacter sp. MYb221 TaxID=1848598 RepID=UPI0015E45B35|nr:hypothetical protein [Arthrobacter sp. MYb221]